MRWELQIERYHDANALSIGFYDIVFTATSDYLAHATDRPRGNPAERSEAGSVSEHASIDFAPVASKTAHACLRAEGHFGRQERFV
jgi:hypothetical protein